MNFLKSFKKVQHSHSRHQETTSNLLRIHLQGKLMFGNSSPLEGAMYIFGGIPKMLVFAIFSKYWWFQTKQFTRLLEFIKLYKQNPLEKIFIFTLYQNYTLALMLFTKDLTSHLSCFESAAYNYSKEFKNLKLESCKKLGCIGNCLLTVANLIIKGTKIRLILKEKPASDLKQHIILNQLSPKWDPLKVFSK